jgi:hypothetical protein
MTDVRQPGCQTWRTWTATAHLTDRLGVEFYVTASLPLPENQSVAALRVWEDWDEARVVKAAAVLDALLREGI